MIATLTSLSTIISVIVIGLFVVFLVIPILFSFFGFDNIVLNPEIFEFLYDGTITDIFNMIYYIFPVNFGLKVLVFVLIVRHYSKIKELIDWVINKFVGR